MYFFQSQFVSYNCLLNCLLHCLMGCLLAVGDSLGLGRACCAALAVFHCPLKAPLRLECNGTNLLVLVLSLYRRT